MVNFVKKYKIIVIGLPPEFFHRGGRRTRVFTRRTNSPQTEQQPNYIQLILQLLPVVLLIILSFMSFSPHSSNQPLFSLHKTDVYSVKRRSQV